MDIVHDNFMAIPLEIRPNEDIRTLGDAMHTFIQWRKKEIALDPAVPQPRHDHFSPTGPSMTPPQPSLQKTTSSVPVEKTPKEQEKCATVSVPESSRRKICSGPVVKAKSKLMNIKVPPKSLKYSIGSPLVTDIVLA